MAKRKTAIEPLDHAIHAKKYNPESVAKRASKEKELNIAHNAIQYQMYEYDNKNLDISFPYTSNDCIVPMQYAVRWINVDGIQEKAVRNLCNYYGVHNLQADDILSEGQRAKLDNYQDDRLFVLMPMLRLSKDGQLIEAEQLSLILGDKILLSFQSEEKTDPFQKIRDNLSKLQAPLRTKATTDFLFYSLIDEVVDDYFIVLDFLSTQLDQLEYSITNNLMQKASLQSLSEIRKQLLFVKRQITPVKDLINTLYSEPNALILSNNRKYFKDVLDHILIAIEYAETYLEWAGNLQDLYMSQVNSKTNDVMKILTVVTTLLAPATVVGTIFGMNFNNMPLINNPNGFLLSMLLTFLLSIVMLFYFKKKNWF